MQPNRNVKNKLNILPQSNAKQVEQFCGLINFYGRFILSSTTKLSPVSELRKTDKTFKRTTKNQNTFKLLKKVLASKPLVQPHCVKKEVIVKTDASENAIGGILSQEGHSVIDV